MVAIRVYEDVELLSMKRTHLTNQKCKAPIRMYVDHTSLFEPVYFHLIVNEQ